MTSKAETEDIEDFFERLSYVKDYSSQVFKDQNPLTAEERENKDTHIQEMMSTGYSLGLTLREVTLIILRGTFDAAS